jgi:hypothetical protein
LSACKPCWRKNCPCATTLSTPEEDKLLSSFQFLSRKPQIVVFNQSEDQAPLEYRSPHPHTTSVSLPAKLEMDIAALDPEDAAILWLSTALPSPVFRA